MRQQLTSRRANCIHQASVAQRRTFPVRMDLLWLHTPGRLLRAEFFKQRLGFAPLHGPLAFALTGLP